MATLIDAAPGCKPGGPGRLPPVRRGRSGYAYTPGEVARVAALHRQGLTDREIHERLPDLFISGKSVGMFRRRRGLRCNRDTRSVGFDIGGFKRAHTRATATAYGLPPDLKPGTVAVVLALADGPLTFDQLATAAGSRGGLPNRLFDLRTRGLVVRFRHPDYPLRRLYMLSGTAMAALSGEGRDTP